ncbi:3-deoxy-8-phosphooctulonate synthase, partial [Campylobacter upsaliensis]|nr:3-deoxy-8-phosphooctulonate synthase [Campylobacter upsaliensis]
GVDGFFFETHINPCEALCDGANMLNIKRLKDCVSTLLKIQEII